MQNQNVSVPSKTMRELTPSEVLLVSGGDTLTHAMVDGGITGAVSGGLGGAVEGGVGAIPGAVFGGIGGAIAGGVRWALID